MVNKKIPRDTSYYIEYCQILGLIKGQHKVTLQTLMTLPTVRRLLSKVGYTFLRPSFRTPLSYTGTSIPLQDL